MKFRILLLLIFQFYSLIYAQEAGLRGTIIDSKSGLPVQGAVVYIPNYPVAYSNNDGYYSIKFLPAGKYQVKVSRLGYLPVTDSVLIRSEVVSKDFYMESSPVELDEVIVSTDRTDKFLRNSPYSELLLGKESIQNKPFQTLPDILKEEPGISLMRDGIWGTEISIRGLNRDNLVTLVDGNRIATSTDIAARLSLFNTNDIERIEIIKGASSALYGSGATGGIVNIITRSPGLYDEFGFNGNIAAGFNSVNNLSAVSGLITGGSSFWSSKLSASYRKAGNTQTPAGELKNSQFEDYSLTAGLNLFPLQNHLLKFDYQLFKANDVGIPGASIFPVNAEVRYPDEKRELISAGYEIQNISKSFYKLSVKFSRQLIERNVENIPYTVQNIPASGTNPARRVSVLKILPGADHNNNNLQVHGNFLLTDDNSLVAGIDYWDRTYNGRREKHQLIEVLNPQGNVVSSINKIIGEKPLPDSKYKSLGIFAQDNAQFFNGRLQLTAGLRYDRIFIEGETTYNPVYEITNGVVNYFPASQKIIWNRTEAVENSYSANIGLKYSLNPDFDLTLSTGLSFRSPSLEERFQFIDQGSFVRVGNPYLNPETGKSVDLGLRYYSLKLKIVSSIFFNYFDNLVSEIPGLFDGRNAFIKTNIGKARLYGFDFRADYNFYSDHLFYFISSFVKGDDISSGGDLSEIPPLNGSAGIKFSYSSKLSIVISSDYSFGQISVAEGERSTAGYALLNLSVNSGVFDLFGSGIRINAGVENIFNKEYRNHLSTIRGNLIFEPGRNFFVKLIADF